MSKIKPNCPFCDSARHIAINCTSTMHGKYTALSNVMKSRECPDFNSYATNELKLIAFETPYERNLSILIGMGSNKLNRKCGRNPISLTLSRKQLCKSLKHRWELLRPITDRYNNGPNNEEDNTECPICYDNITECIWDCPTSDWTIQYKLGSVRTICNHYYCGNCWKNVKLANETPECKSCPLCRRHINVLFDIWVRQIA